MTYGNPLGAPVPPQFPFTQTVWQRIKARLAQRIDGWRFDYAIWCGYYARDATPLRCECCDAWHWTDHKETTMDSINGLACEIEMSCRKCGHAMGYWAYGYWQPPYI
ncbi:hypothetical protein [Vibrio phage vB_VhaS-tm]|nr:hypothetical protein [Vibrio phage vB_VhaS-tm]